MSGKMNMAKALLRAARRAGAEEADLMISGGSELGITVRMGELDVLEEADAGVVVLRVFKERRMASISATNLGGLDPELFAEEAVALSAFGEPDEFNRLPEAELYATEFPELDLVDETTLPTTEQGVEMARSAEAAALDADRRIDNSQGGLFSRNSGEGIYLTSNGFEKVRNYTHFMLTTVPVARDSADGLVTAYWTEGRRHSADLPEPAEVGRRAAERLLRMLDSRPAPTGEFPVIFEGVSTASRLLRILFGAAAGPAIRRRQSYLIDRLGDRVASDLFTMVDDPHRLRGYGSRSSDGEGLPCQRREVVTRGILNFTPTDVENARRLDIPVTGHGNLGGGVSASNLYLEPGELTPEEIIASVKRGLLITKTLGNGNLNNNTGHWSQACEGLWIEDGEIAYPVSKVTFAGSMDDILGGIDAVGSDLDFNRGSACSPTLRVRSLTLAGS